MRLLVDFLMDSSARGNESTLDSTGNDIWLPQLYADVFSVFPHCYFDDEEEVISDLDEDNFSGVHAMEPGLKGINKRVGGEEIK